MIAPASTRETCPLFDIENEVCAVVDHLAVVEGLLSGSRGNLEPEEISGIERIVSRALDDARKVRGAWRAVYGEKLRGPA